MRISIIGAGNGGQAMAAHLAILGHAVTLYNRTFERIKPLIQEKSIELTGSINGIGVLKHITGSLSEAIIGADLIMVTTTANAHRDLAMNMAPLLQPNQVVVLNPGRTLGALEFGNTVRSLTTTNVYVAEAQSLIYACRIESPGKVRVIGVKDKVLLAAYPSRHTDHVINIVNSVYNCFVKADNVLVTSLENIGAIFHPAVVLFNAAAIERGDEFFFYGDMTPSVAQFLEQFDSERLKIGSGFGIRLKPVSEWISYAYQDIKGYSLCEKMRNNPAYDKIVAPKTLHSRLLLEDIPAGLLPFSELAKIVNVKTPLINSVIQIAQSLIGLDFQNNGRTLINLGIKSKTGKALIANL